MQRASIENDLVRKVLRSVTESKMETVEEIQYRYTQLHPPSFFMRKMPSVSIQNLEWALRFLVREEYVRREITRYTDRVLKHDTPVYQLSQKGLAFVLKKK